MDLDIDAKRQARAIIRIEIFIYLRTAPGRRGLSPGITGRVRGARTGPFGIMVLDFCGREVP